MVKIGNRIIGKGQPAYIIAEMSANHAGDIENAKAYFYKAAYEKPELGFGIGLWYYYDLGDKQMGKDYLKYAEWMNSDVVSKNVGNFTSVSFSNS